LLFALTIPLGGQAASGSNDLADSRSAALVQRVGDRKLSADERGTALAELEVVDPARAVEVAPLVLADDDPLLRARAAWILAEAGSDAGIAVLRAMASEKSEESVIAITTLGRLRDAGSHALLRTLLEQELGADGRPKVSRISALTKSLGDYTDKTDAALLARAVALTFSPADWPMVNDLGKTGGRDAIPLLEEIFLRTGKSSTVVAAGLGLARCGSERGVNYVLGRIAGAPDSQANGTVARPSTAAPHEAFTARATDFIFDLLGLPADEVFVPTLIRIVSAPESPNRSKAQAWGALLRINSAKYRAETLELAWKNTTFQSAVRLIALNDEPGARRIIADSQSRMTAAGPAIDVAALKQALAATRRERRQWRETHGYTF
jgi:HEAT repeat protein